MYYIFKEVSTYHLFRQIKIQYFVYFKSELLCSSWHSLERCLEDFTLFFPSHFPNFSTEEIILSELIIQGKELVRIFDYPPTLDNVREFNPELLL